MTTDTVKTEEKGLGLATYDIDDAKIAEMSDKYLPLKVDGPEDTEGVKKITEYRIKTKGVRVNIEHRRKANNEKANTFIKGNNAKAKTLTAAVVIIEESLIKQEKIVKDEKDRLKEIEQKKLQVAHEDKIKRIVKAGAVFNGFEYVYGDNSIEETRIRLLDDEMFNLQIGKIELWKEKEDRAIAEAERIAKEHEENQAKIAKENEEKAAELKAREEAQDKKDREQKDAQDKIDEGNKKFLDGRNDSRIKELTGLGMMFNFHQSAFAFEDIYVEMEKLKKLDSEDWAGLINRLKPEIEKIKEQIKINAEKRHQKEIKDAEDKATAKVKSENEAKEKERITTEKKAKDAADRKARLAPDKEKLYEYAKGLFEVMLPDLKNEESKKFFEPIHTEIVKAIDLIRERSGVKASDQINKLNKL